MVYYIVVFKSGRKECFESFMKAIDVFRTSYGAVKVIGVEGDVITERKDIA